MNKHITIRTITVILTALLLLPLLAGCHGARESAAFELPSTFDTSKTYEISFWAKNDTNITQVEIYKKAIADFEALYPNIKVNLKLYTDYGKIYNDVITNIATATTPNVCITYPDHIATYMTGENTVVPLDTLMNDRKYGLGGSEVRFDSPKKSEVVEKFLDECWLDGYYYALPYMRSTEACYVNKTYVEKLGYTLPEVLTWDFIWEVSEAAMAKNADGTFKVNGQKVLIPFIYKSSDNMMIQMLKQQNADYSTASGEIGIFNETTREILYTVAEHAGTRAFSNFTISGYPANFLNAGQCIFAIDSTAGATWMGCEAPLIDISADKVATFETEVMMIPQYDPEKPQMISQGPSMCIFNKEDPQEVLASWLFMQFMLTDSVQIAYSQTEGYLPVTTKAQTSATYTDYLAREGEDNDLYYDVKLQATKLLMNHIDDTFTTPVFNGSASLRDAAGQMITEVTKSMRRKQNVDEAYLEKLFSDMNALYRLDRIESSGGKVRFGALPTTAVILLLGIAAAWVSIAAYLLVEVFKKHRRRQKK